MRMNSLVMLATVLAVLGGTIAALIGLSDYLAARWALNKLSSGRPTGWRGRLVVRLRSEPDGGRQRYERDLRRGPRVALIGLIIFLVGVCTALAWCSIAVLIEHWNTHGQLGPGDAGPVVTAVVSITGVVGCVIASIVGVFAKLVTAKGKASADVMTAQAELIRAQAEVIRAQNGLPPGVATVSSGGGQREVEPPEPAAPSAA
ncbi:hypothetical protein [Kitasatospora cineracea]|uniref:hypothetical protein n=1 Tax=Kitasatospora cineracea TaxID=88074 RepID=UPI0011CE1907|nr:hypothetical protein [Kitasatospora cineracea]